MNWITVAEELDLENDQGQKEEDQDSQGENQGLQILYITLTGLLV